MNYKPSSELLRAAEQADRNETRLKTFREIFAQTRQLNNWDSNETAHYYAKETGRSVSTIYRWLDKCPDLVTKLLNRR